MIGARQPGCRGAPSRAALPRRASIRHLGVRCRDQLADSAFVGVKGGKSLIHDLLAYTAGEVQQSVRRSGSSEGSAVLIVGAQALVDCIVDVEGFLVKAIHESRQRVRRPFVVTDRKARRRKRLVTETLEHAS